MTTLLLAIATHDSKLVKEAISLLKGQEIIKSIQFQFLKGIRDELKRQLMDLVSGSTLHMEKDGSPVQLGEFVKEKGT